MSDNDLSSKLIRLGIKDFFVEHGTQKELYEICEYDANAVVKAVLSNTKSKKTSLSSIAAVN